MVRVYQITVSLGPDGKGGLKPIAFVYRGGRHMVIEVLDCFTMRGRNWWEDETVVGKAPHEVLIWRVRTREEGVFELCQDGNTWTMFKVYD